MSEYAMFYNSENGDRVYDADSFSNWLKKFFTTGVFEGDCQVTALGSMVVNLAPGYANIMGKVKELENQTFTLEPADGSYPRIDTIVIERNDTDRDITAKVVTGELSGNDPIPTPRVWENGVYQLIVAEIYVAAGATEVTQANITDKRSDPDVCGIVAGTVTEMDFSQFTAQFESYFEQFKASNLEEFDEWFQHMKDQLDTDAAGHLQNEIDAINAKIPSGASASNKMATASDIAEINSDLNGFKFYPAGTGIVGLIADDSAYTDANGKYVIWGTATANQLVADNPDTYKSVPSEEDCRGEVGADSATPFSKADNKLEWLFQTYIAGGTSAVVFNNLDVDIKYLVMPMGYGNNLDIKVNNVSAFSQITKLATPTSENYNKYTLIKLPISKGDKLEITSPQYGSTDYLILGTSADIEVLEVYKHPNQTTTSIFTADREYKELYVYVGGASRMTLQASSMNIHPLALVHAGQGYVSGYFYKFFNVKIGDTITFYNQYADNGNIACVFKLV